MQIVFEDSKIKTVAIKTLSLGDVFMIPDGYNDVCIYIGKNGESGLHEYLVFGVGTNIDCVREDDFQVRQVNSKLIVEI